MTGAEPASLPATAHCLLGAGSAIPGPVPMELMVVTDHSIGKKLLRSMGWKDGQGIGPRVKRAADAPPAKVLPIATH